MRTAGVMRWALVLAPMIATTVWLRASAAQPGEPMSVAVAPAPLASTVRPPAYEPEPDPEPEPEPEPEPPAHPCAEESTTSLERRAAEVFSGSPDRKAVALSFDDGPSRQNTPDVLRVLRQADVRATFFVLGDRAERMGDLLAEIADEGHEIGNHGYSHTSMRSLWKSQIRDEVCRTHRAIEVATGRSPTLLRPPFGRYAPSAVPLLGGLGYDLVLWSVDAHDWESDDPQALARSVVRAAQPGAVILMHDREPVTAQALPSIVAGLERRGFEIVPVSALTDLRSPQR